MSFTKDIGLAFLAKLISWFPELNMLHPWAFFGLMLVLAIVLSQAVAWFFRVVLKGLTLKTQTEADDIIISHIQQPIAWFIFSLLLYVAFAPLRLGSWIDSLVQGLLLSLNILVLGYGLYQLAKAVFMIWQATATKTKSTIDETFLPLVSKFVYAVIWLAAFLFVLDSWGVVIGPFLAGLGIVGLAIGFAVQDSLGNIFGGIFLALDSAYKVGDKVRLGDGTVGIVHDISLRSTRIKTYDGDLVMVPNGNIANENIYTFAQPKNQSRVQVDFGVEYGSDPDEVEKLVLDVVKAIPDILEDPKPACHFRNMGDSALEMRAYFWVATYKKAYAKKLEVTKAIYKALNKSKIGIPFPTQTIYLRKD